MHSDLFTAASNDLFAIVNALNGGVAPNNNSYLLSQAFPEGSPMHPSYGQGHAVAISASVSILKAFYNPSTSFNKAVRVNSDGSALLDMVQSEAALLTVEGELNKLISNIGTGRNIAGVHFRSDAEASDVLGEQVAIRILQDLKV